MEKVSSSLPHPHLGSSLMLSLFRQLVGLSSKAGLVKWYRIYIVCGCVECVNALTCQYTLIHVSVIQSSSSALVNSHFCGQTWWGMYDFTNYYHSQLDGAQVYVNKTLAHSLCNLNSPTWLESRDFRHLILFNWLYCCRSILKRLQTFRHLPAFSEETLQLFTNATHRHQWLLPYLFIFGRPAVTLDADLFAVGERSLTTALSLSQGKNQAITHSPQLSIWKLWVRSSLSNILRLYL